VDLFICFEEPFWIALVFVTERRGTKLFRHVFGAEPTDPEVEAFVRERLAPLVAGDPAGFMVRAPEPLPSTRAARLRLVEETVSGDALTPDVREALARGRVTSLARRRAIARDERREAAERRRAIARDQARERHRGR